MSKDHSIVTAINILIHVALLLTILVSVFVFYVSKVEHKALQGHIQESLNKAVANGLQHLSVGESRNMKTFLDLNEGLLERFKAANEKRDHLVVEYNTQLLQRMMLCVAVVLVSLMTLMWTLKSGCNISASDAFKFLLFENGCIFIFALAFEVYFFTNIVSKFVPLAPSAVAQYAEQATENVLKSA